MAALLLLEEREYKIGMYREELCVQKKLHKRSVTTRKRLNETLLQKQ